MKGLEGIFATVSLTDKQKAQQRVYKLEAKIIYGSDSEKAAARNEIEKLTAEFGVKTCL